MKALKIEPPVPCGKQPRAKLAVESCIVDGFKRLPVTEAWHLPGKVWLICSQELDLDTAYRLELISNQGRFRYWVTPTGHGMTFSKDGPVMYYYGFRTERF